MREREAELLRALFTARLFLSRLGWRAGCMDGDKKGTPKEDFSLICPSLNAP